MEDVARTRPRVLVLTSTFPGSIGDGTPQFVLDLALVLAPTHDITIVAPRMPGSARRETTNGVSVERFSYFPRRWERLATEAIMPTLRRHPTRTVEVPFFLLRFWWTSLKVLRRTRPDAIHAHWLIPGGLIAWTLNLLFGTPYIVTVLGADAYTLRSAPFRLLKKAVIKRASVIAPLSTDMAETLGLQASPTTAVVPLGVDVAALQRDVTPRSPQFGRLLFVGRLAEKKGVDVLLRAIAPETRARVVIVGDGPERARLQELASQLGVAERVDFLGRQPRSRVLEEYARAHAVVIPSRVGRDGDQDGTPLVMCEALAAGVPVIASRLGGIAEHIDSGTSGLLVQPDSVDELSTAVRRALDDPTTPERWGRAGAEVAKRSLDIALTSTRYEEFFARASSSGRSTS